MRIQRLSPTGNWNTLAEGILKRAESDWGKLIYEFVDMPAPKYRIVLDQPDIDKIKKGVNG